MSNALGGNDLGVERWEMQRGPLGNMFRAWHGGLKCGAARKLLRGSLAGGSGGTLQINFSAKARAPDALTFVQARDRRATCTERPSPGFGNLPGDAAIDPAEETARS